MRRAPTLALLCVSGMLLPLWSQLGAGSAGTMAWLIDLASHWQWLFLAGLVIFGGLAIRSNRYWVAILLAMPLPWLTAAAQAPIEKERGQVLTVASANISLRNSDAAPLFRWLSANQVDIVAILEVSPEYAARLRSSTDFPYQRAVPSAGPFGIALLSRYPFSDVQVVRDPDGIAHIEAKVQWQELAVNLVAIHPMPPLSAHYHRVRNDKLRDLAAAAGSSSFPTIVAGDLNATPWSSAFSGLSEQGLRRATGLAPSWPALMGGMLGIPIDHVLVTSEWAIVDSALGPDLGSDHLPVLVRLTLRRPVVDANNGNGAMPPTWETDLVQTRQAAADPAGGHATKSGAAATLPHPGHKFY